MTVDATAAPLSLPMLGFNLVLGIGLSLIIAWYYQLFGASLSNRSQFAPILPMLTLITLLVITIVKSSLALSLGLVGALSIVRFRTAIKDPAQQAHALKGMGGNMMAARVHELGCRTELAARQGQPDAAQLAEQLAQAMEALLAAMNAWLAEDAAR